MRATPEWMAEKYNELNEWLFNGKLGQCGFECFTTGRGSRGSWLGRFRLSGSSLKADRYSRQLYKNNFGRKEFINHDNFIELCKPIIGLNGHYTGTEQSLLSTLVHEMCHYYNYMYGYMPKQAHGPEFRYIASIVSDRSDGVFTVQRVATAEQMEGYELDDDMKKKRDEKKERMKSRLIAVMVFKTDGIVELTTTTSQNVVAHVISYNTSPKMSNEFVKIVTSTDRNLIDFLYSKGYSRPMRTYRYWEVKPEKLGGADFLDKGGYSYTVAAKGTKTESKKPIGTIIECVINEYMNKNFVSDCDITIPTYLNLGVMSPFETKNN